MVTQVLLTVADAAKELNVEPWEINRLIARQTLTADAVGDGKYRISASAIERVAASTDLEGPKIFQNWIDARLAASRSNSFSVRARQVLEDGFPEEDPGQDVSVAFSGKLRDLANEDAPEGMVRIVDAETLPYKTNAEVYAAAQFSRVVQKVVRQHRGSGLSLTTNLIAKLYTSPELYQQFVQEGWELFQSKDLVATKFYEGSTPGRPVNRRRVLQHSTLPVSFDRLAKLVF